MSLSTVKQRHISLIVVSIVGTQFAMLCNPKFRGPKFTWNKFEGMVSGIVESNLFIYLNHKQVTQEELDFALNECRYRCQTMLDFSGFLNDDRNTRPTDN